MSGSRINRSFSPHSVQIISFRGNGFFSGDSTQVVEHVAHWKH